MSQRKAFLLRVTPGLHRALERWSRDELRSVNAQIEYLLAQAVRQAGRSAPDEDDDASGNAPDATGIP